MAAVSDGLCIKELLSEKQSVLLRKDVDSSKSVLLNFTSYRLQSGHSPFQWLFWSFISHSFHGMRSHYSSQETGFKEMGSHEK